MENIRSVITSYIMKDLNLYFPDQAEWLFSLIVLMWIIVCGAFLHLILHKVLIKLVDSMDLVDREGTWLHEFHSFRLFHNLILILQCAYVQLQVNAWVESGTFLSKALNLLSEIGILFFSLMSLFSLLNSCQNMINAKASRLRVPIKGAIQSLKLVASLLFALLVLALVLGKSPFLLVSGFGALSAVLMLVFKDPILGLVAGVQLSANNMLTVGDWLEMPKYNADGSVVDIGLTTVKVQNWDKTITTIPTYALISDSFKNWRGMSESGGRRIKRSILISPSSVQFLTEEEIQALKKANLLVSYLNDKTESIKEDNLSLDMSTKINGRRLTNLGTFRAYLSQYLVSHKKIAKDKTLMVRQLEANSKGLPLEVYAFAATTSWDEYEAIQADLFDHIFAVVSEFGLKVHESPTGEDLKIGLKN